MFVRNAEFCSRCKKIVSYDALICFKGLLAVFAQHTCFGSLFILYNIFSVRNGVLSNLTIVLDLKYGQFELFNFKKKIVDRSTILYSDVKGSTIIR